MSTHALRPEDRTPSRIASHGVPVLPLPGEMWLYEGGPVIVTKLTEGRVWFIRPYAEEPGYHESWSGPGAWHDAANVRLWPRGNPMADSEATR